MTGKLNEKQKTNMQADVSTKVVISEHKVEDTDYDTNHMMAELQSYPVLSCFSTCCSSITNDRDHSTHPGWHWI